MVRIGLGTRKGEKEDYIHVKIGKWGNGYVETLKGQRWQETV